MGGDAVNVFQTLNGALHDSCAATKSASLLRVGRAQRAYSSRLLEFFFIRQQFSELAKRICHALCTRVALIALMTQGDRAFSRNPNARVNGARVSRVACSNLSGSFSAASFASSIISMHSCPKYLACSTTFPAESTV